MQKYEKFGIASLMLLRTEDFVDLGLSAAAAKRFEESNKYFEISRLIFNCQQILIAFYLRR